MCNCCNANDIGDIGGFWYYGGPPHCYGHQDLWGISMCLRLNYGTNPSDSLALYVADNPAGPARKVITIKPINSPPPEGGVELGIRHDTLPDSACYYYWLDHGTGYFPSVRDPKRLDLYPNQHNPVCYLERWAEFGPRDFLDPPNISQLVDPPTNNGDELFVHWELSLDDDVVDVYNIYREIAGSGGGYHWIGSAPPGTTTFRDSSAIPGVTFNYRVSAAHHGAGGGAVSSANRGIWNDFSEPQSATPINDFPIITSFIRECPNCPLIPMPQSSAVGCPQGDVDKLVIEVKIGAIAGEASCVPAEALTLSQPAGPNSAFYPENVVIHADSTTMFVAAEATVSNAHCRTTFTVSSFGGCGSDSALVSLYGIPLGYAHFNITSPDVVIGTTQSRGIVDTADWGRFGVAYQSSICDCVYANDYDACVDYVPADTTIQLNDLGFFWSHWHHSEPGGESAPRSEGTGSGGNVVLQFEEVHPVIGEHKLLVDMSLEGVEPFTAAVFVLRNENLKLEFVGWTESGDFLGETVCTETIRDGHREVFVGALGQYDDNMGNAALGTVVFRVHSDDELQLTDEDLALVSAEVLSNDGAKAVAMSAFQAHRVIEPVLYKDELAQNYPNPFNPLTTIAFSLRRNSDVSLAVYDVRGSLVRELVDGRRERGIHRVIWDGTNASGQRVVNGIYFCKLIAGGFSDTRKMLVLK